MAIDGIWSEGTETTADNLNAGAIQYGTLASRPTAGQKGRVFVRNDPPAETIEAWRDNGSTWDQILDVSTRVHTHS